jgi:hypothetical protein
MTTRRSFLAAAAGAICLPFTGLRPQRDVWAVVEEAQRLYGKETTLHPINPRIAWNLAGCCGTSSGLTCFNHQAMMSLNQRTSGDVMDICNVIVPATAGDVHVCVRKMRSTCFNWSFTTLLVLGEIAANDGKDTLWAWHGNETWPDLHRIGIKYTADAKMFAKTLWDCQIWPCKLGTPNCRWHLHDAPGVEFCVTVDIVEHSYGDSLLVSFHQAPHIAGHNQVPPAPG